MNDMDYYSSEKNSVLSEICKKYREIYSQLFGKPYSSELNYDDNERLIYCKRKQLMRFGWTFLLSMKIHLKKFNTYEQLLNLLIACCDFLYSCCVVSDCKNLLNESFSELFGNNLGDGVSSAYPIIKTLCSKYGGVESKIRDRKDWIMKILTTHYIKNKVLCSKSENLFELFKDDLLEVNYHAMDQFYSTNVLKTVLCDERKYLEKTTSSLISGGRKCEDENSVPIILDKNESSVLQSTYIRTPLSGKMYANNRQNYKMDVKTAGSHLITQFLSERNPYPSKRLSELIQSHGVDLVKNKVDEMSEVLICNLPQIDSSLSVSIVIKMVKTLYYKILEDIIAKEFKMKNRRYSHILKQDVFHYTLFVCCADIIILWFSSKLVFTELSALFKIHGFHFFKIIEIIVRTERQLPYNTIKHLQTIEEHVLDKISWEHNSPLWKNLKMVTVVPNSVNVSLPHETINESNLISGTDLNVRLERTKNMPGTNDIEQDNKNKRNPLYFFFKKFYYLAAIRISDLLDKLKIQDAGIKRRIWTMFEYIITRKTEIMHDRHLDQILLCTVYVSLKKTKFEQTFSDIIDCYRLQPQANRDIFRNVLISSKTPNDIHYSSDSENKNLLEVRGDIIKFYNNVFCKHIDGLMENFFSESSSESLKLSPMPLTSPISPLPSHRISEKHLVFIRFLDNSSIPSMNSPSSFTHCFDKSPAKNLETINKALQCKNLKRKNIAEDLDKESAVDTKKISTLANKLQNLIEERKEKT